MTKKSNKYLSNRLKENYNVWKNYCLKNENYFVIFNKFKEEKLKNINGNALKLYIYLGIYSDTYTGEVWHSTKKIADYFGKSERTIRNWMKDLEDLNLVYRMQLKINEESHTFLQPYIFTNDSKVEKYIYKFRINSIEIRKNVPLIFFEDKIINISKKYFKNKIYISVYMDYITIISYKPINKIIKEYAKLLNMHLKELINLYIQTNIKIININNTNWNFESFKDNEKVFLTLI